MVHSVAPKYKFVKQCMDDPSSTFKTYCCFNSSHMSVPYPEWLIINTLLWQSRQISSETSTLTIELIFPSQNCGSWDDWWRRPDLRLKQRHAKCSSDQPFNRHSRCGMSMQKGWSKLSSIGDWLCVFILLISYVSLTVSSLCHGRPSTPNDLNTGEIGMSASLGF